MAKSPPMPPSGKNGYSCQTIIAKKFNEWLHRGTYYCWYSTEFNPKKSPDSSNPLWLYQTVSRAVQNKDIKNPKIEQIRLNLMFAATDDAVIGEKHDPRAEQRLNHALEAGIEMFWPQVWRIKHLKVDKRAKRGKCPEERKLTDLKRNEFDIIVD
jgi:hypothetical protein